ncbi:MAG: fluoride efflux transporter CrcB [Trueperaceae bacterium]|nr:fluoride efflux transporter CrcB [Trueperaceae bacterium]MCO5175084.1 fluoride efflux transporter CrcB [Trueperaceae bacterium]MCW5820858.1 fluoride efflux transporter CrcB [Trueperaceae bacterium]
MSQPLAAIVAVATGGAVGSVLRYAFTLWFQNLSKGFPLGTLLVNVLGSFVITFVGAATAADGRNPLPEVWRLAILVGVCGGYTTFSSFSLQTLDLLRAGFVGRAAANVLLSVGLCLGAAALGYLAAARLGSGG